MSTFHHTAGKYKGLGICIYWKQGAYYSTGVKMLLLLMSTCYCCWHFLCPRSALQESTRDSGCAFHRRHLVFSSPKHIRILNNIPCYWTVSIIDIIRYLPSPAEVFRWYLLASYVVLPCTTVMNFISGIFHRP